MLADIRVVTDYSECASAVECLLRDNNRVLGLDTEWVPSSSTSPVDSLKVALIQLSSGTHTCLFHLRAMYPEIQSSGFPSPLSVLLGDESIVKAGVSIAEDANRLAIGFGVTVRNAVDLVGIQLRMEHLGVLGDTKPLPTGLSSLAFHYLGMDMDKGQCLSNWEALPLSYDQVMYAGRDAWVGHALLHHLVGVSGIDLWDLIKGLDGVRVHEQRKWYLPDQPVEEEKGRQRGLAPECYMQAPDGTPMCMLPTKKVDWYLSKGLARVVSEDPTTIRLVFEPKGLAHAGDEFLLSALPDRCVGCAATHKYIKFHVLPACYRKHLDLCYKTARDTVLLCLACRDKVQGAYRARQELLGDEYGFPVNPSITDPRLILFQRAKEASKALVEGTEDPQGVLRASIQEFVEEFLPGQTPDLPELVKMKLPAALKPTGHGEGVAAVLAEHPDTIPGFIRRWRELFVESLAPQYLPESWSRE